MIARPHSAPVPHHARNNYFRRLVLVFLVFGAFKGWPLLLVQAQELIAPPPTTPQAVVQEVISSTASGKKVISFDEKYKDWVAVMPLHEIRITVHEDWSYETYAHRKVLIQTKDGNGFGEVPIYYDGDTEEIRILRAVTITPDGKEHPPAKTQDLSVYEGYGMYSNMKKRILSMPEVTPGSMVDLEYIKTTKRTPMPKTFWHIQYTEQPIPLREYKITYRIPKSLGVRYKSFVKTWKPEIREEDGETVYVWEKKQYEPNTDPEENLLPPPTAETIGDGIDFSSVKSWQDVAVWYYGLIQKNLKITPEIRRTAEKAVKGRKELRDKVRAILEYMQGNFRYVSMSFGDYSMEPHPTDEVFRNKYGDCKDQSLLAKALLQAVGIEADLALFTPEAGGTDPKVDLPVPGLFDHVLLKVRDPGLGDFYADPLLEGYNIEEYPLDYQAAYTFIITATGGKFDKLPIVKEWQTGPVKDTIEIRIDGSAVDDSENVWDLADSIDLRLKIKAASAEEKNKYFENMKNEMAAGGKILEFSWDGLDAQYGLLKAKAVADRPNVYPVNDGLMVIDLQRESRPDGWSAKERKNPIFFPINSVGQKTMLLKIPAGFEVMHLPKGFSLDNGFFFMRRDIERAGNTITVSQTKRTRRTELPASEYPKIKTFYDKLPSRTEQRIILKKKDGRT